MATTAIIPDSVPKNVPIKNPFFLPIFFISIDAGKISIRVLRLNIAIGKVAFLGSDAKIAPTNPEKVNDKIITEIKIAWEKNRILRLRREGILLELILSALSV
jgi:hypothetical protein